jgi:hypothetical protein
MAKTLIIAAAILLVGIVSTASGARTAPAPSLDQVLASGSNANGHGIQNADEVTLNGIRSDDPFNPATAVTLRQGVQVQASNGGTDENAGSVDLTAGYGNNGSSTGSELHVQGGRGDGTPGYVVVVTGGSAGEPGDCLRNLGGGKAAWGPCTP